MSTEQGTFCQVCHGPWPDGHEPWCPVLTQQPVPGLQSLQQEQLDPLQLQQLQQLQNQLGSMPQRAPQERLFYIIEHLCDHLRELRRDCPEKFFGSPYERLYRTLDATLESFYRDREKPS